MPLHRHGMNLSVAMNVRRAVIESNAKSDCLELFTSKDPPYDIAALVQDCLALNDSFYLCELNFVKHDFNRATHACA